MSDTAVPTSEIPVVEPPTYPIPPAYPGAWFGSYAVVTAGGVDVYNGIATDGSGFHITAPTGTPVWQVLGGTPTRVVPSSITNLQCRRMLRRSPAPNGGTFYDLVDAAIQAGGGDMLDAWEHASQIIRSDPLVQSLIALLGLTDAQADEMFIQAAML